MMEKLQCTCCGGKLVMNANGNAVCQFCGMEYAPEAMKKLIVEMKGTVQVEGVDTADALAKRAETFLSLGERGDARMNFQKLTQLAPDDYRGWWGLTRVFDWDDYFRKNAGEPLEMPSCCQRALRFAPEGKKAEIRAFYNEKAQKIGGRVAQNYAKTQQQLSAIGAKRKQYERMSAALLQEEDEDDLSATSTSPAIRVVAAVYWPVAAAIYLAWSFLGGEWGISWVVWPIAGVLYAGLWSASAALGSAADDTRSRTRRA